MLAIGTPRSRSTSRPATVSTRSGKRSISSCYVDGFEPDDVDAEAVKARAELAEAEKMLEQIEARVVAAGRMKGNLAMPATIETHRQLIAYCKRATPGDCRPIDSMLRGEAVELLDYRRLGLDADDRVVRVRDCRACGGEGWGDGHRDTNARLGNPGSTECRCCDGSGREQTPE